VGHGIRRALRPHRQTTLIKLAGKGRDLYRAPSDRPVATLAWRALLNLVDAYAKFGAKPENRLHGLSAIASDGTMVLSCTPPYFLRPGRGVLRYEDRLSREADESASKTLLGQHLTRARDENLVVRMVVLTNLTPPGGKPSRTIHVREDLVGKVTLFDGDHFIVDFTRSAMADIATAAVSRRR
jgi:hypothetical protein